MYEYMARGALQSLSLPCTPDAPSEFRMLLHEVMILFTNLLAMAIHVTMMSF